MTTQSIQNLLDWLEVKGLLQNRNVAEADLLCDQNAPYTPIYIHILMGFGSLIGFSFVILLLHTLHLLSHENYSYIYMGFGFILFSAIFYFPFRSQGPLLHSFGIQTALLFMIVGKVLFVYGLNNKFPIPPKELSFTWTVTVALLFVTLLTYFIFPNIVDRFLSCLATLLSLLYNLVKEFNNNVPLLIILILSLSALYALYIWRGRPKAWDPLVMVGIVFVSIISLYLSSYFQHFMPSSAQFWEIPLIVFNLAVSAFLIALCLHFSGSLNNIVELPVIFSCIGIVILSLISNNGILWSIALLMLGYGKHNRALTTFGLIFLIFFLIEYYYSLEMTLQHKAYILMGSGVFLLFARVVMKHLNWDKN